MKQKLTILLFLLIGISSRLNAQFDWIFHDSEIAWGAELIYTFDLAAQEKRERAWGDNLATTLSDAKISTLKAINSRAFAQGNPVFSMLEAKQDFLLQEFLRFSAANPQRCYRDMYLAENYPPEELQKLLAQLKPLKNTSTYDENHLLNSKIVAGAQTFYSFKIRQLFFYDQEKQVFGTQLLAVAPMFRNDDQSEGKVLFWFDPGRFNEEELQLNNPEIAIVKLMHFDVPMEEFNPLKPGEDINEIIAKDATDNELQVFLPSSCLPLTETDINYRVLNDIDTVTTIDPDTYEPTYNVVASPFPWAELSSIRLLQHFYFDPHRGRMAMRLFSALPIQDVYQVYGSTGESIYLGRRDLFYAPATPLKEPFYSEQAPSVNLLEVASSDRSESIIDETRKKGEKETEIYQNHSWQKKAYDKLLRNPDVSWAAELYYRFNLGYLAEVGTSSDLNSDLPGARLSIIKFHEQLSGEESKLNFYSRRPSFIKRLMEQRHAADRVYRESRLKNEIPVQETELIRVQIDTVTTYDPDTYEPIQRIIRNDFDLASIAYYQIRQLFYYHQPTRAFRTQILAIAPIARLIAQGGETIGERKMFWFDPGRFEEAEMDKSHPAINIVKLMEVEVPLERFRVLKSPSNRGMEWLFDALKENRLSAFNPNYPNEKLERAAILKARAALPKYSKLREDGLIEQPALRILQHVYIDLESCRLGAKWLSLAPTEMIMDAQAQLLESKPVFIVPAAAEKK